MAGFRRTGQTRRGGRTGSNANCPSRKSSAGGHHKALPYDQLPALMARLAEIDSVASRALQFTILTCARTGEALGAQWEEIDFDKRSGPIPGPRMKMGSAHEGAALRSGARHPRRQHDERGKNPHVFPGRPMRGLSNMALAMLSGGSRSTPPYTAFASARVMDGRSGRAVRGRGGRLALSVSNPAVPAYRRSSMLERRRPVLAAWSSFVTGSNADNVVELRRSGA